MHLCNIARTVVQESPWLPSVIGSLCIYARHLKQCLRSHSVLPAWQRNPAGARTQECHARATVLATGECLPKLQGCTVTHVPSGQRTSVGNREMLTTARHFKVKGGGTFAVHRLFCWPCFCARIPEMLVVVPLGGSPIHQTGGIVQALQGQARSPCFYARPPPMALVVQCHGSPLQRTG